MTKLQQNTQIVDAKTLFWNRVQLIMIFIVFLAPIIGAFLYMNYGSKTFNNYGEIYQPVRQVDNLLLHTPEQSIELNSMRRQWIFLAVVNQVCDQACEFNLLKIRQLKAMQNNNMRRIRTVFIYNGLQNEFAQDLIAKYSPIEGYRIDKSEFDKWTKTLIRQHAESNSEQNRIYMIDPAGNLMMSYPSDADPSLIKKDIKRLLRASQIG